MAISTFGPLTDEPAKRPQGRVAPEFSGDSRKVAVAILGFGTVGKAVAEMLCRQSLPQFRLTHIFNRNVERKWVSWVPDHVRWTEDIDEVLASDVDVVVELAGGIEPAMDWVQRALLAGKSVVTANKHLIANHGGELLELAQRAGQRLEYGASVAGGVPVLCGLEQGLAGERLFRVAGVLNGTCNYILSNMESRGCSFAEALVKAQELGYAEADPSDDVNGVDASCKLAIVARVGLKAKLLPGQVLARTIRGIESEDFQYAKKLGCTIRQVSLAEVKGKELLAVAQPALVPLSSPLAQTRDNQNAVVTAGVYGGETVFAGRGAGGGPTSVAVVSDLLSVAQAKAPSLASAGDELKSYFVTGDMECAYYLRLNLRRGATSSGAFQKILSKHGLEPNLTLQKPRGFKACIALTLEPCRTSAVEAALQELVDSHCLSHRPLALPILS